MRFCWRDALFFFFPLRTALFPCSKCSKHSLAHAPCAPCHAQCTTTRYRVQDLEPDTLYRINIRTVVTEDGTKMYGYWSDDVFLATLAPMAVRVASVAEEHCLVKWRRKGAVRPEGSHNKTTTLQNVNRSSRAQSPALH